MSDRQRFQGVGSGSGGCERPTFQLAVPGGNVSVIALYGGGPFSVTDLSDNEFRERIDIYARMHDLFRGVDMSVGRDDAVRRLIEIGLEHCAQADYIESQIERRKAST